ncbi:hypothetical protein, partial [Escherichia coli]|uniref:hypothetical protein n=2 Tax=Enterobacterales TaxID=91347 RepID=UPI0010CB9F4D
IYICLELYLCVSKKGFNMDERPLTSQYLFKQSLRIPVFSAIYFGIFSWLGHSPQFDSEGFNNFIAISKLPIALLSLSIPFVAVVANIHRTVQTNRQIEETKQKNLSDSYYSHLKFVTDYFTNLPNKTIKRERHYGTKEISYKINYPIHLYRYIFINSSPEKGRPKNTDKEYIREVNNHWVDILKNLEKINSSNRGSQFDEVLIRQMQSLHSIEKHLSELNRMLCLTPMELNEHATLYFDGYEMITNFMSSIELGDTIETYFKFTIDILDITDNFLSFKDDGSSGQIIILARLLKDNNPAIFDEIVTNKGKAQPSLTYNGDRLATEH